MQKHIDLAKLSEVKGSLSAGDFCLLSGTLFTARDQAHIRLLNELKRSKTLPYGLEGACIFYAGPSPAKDGYVFGSVGPTTSARMDFAAPELYRAGLIATIGKGVRSENIAEVCKEKQTLYFVAVGGAACELANHVISSELVAYEDLGPEAIRKIEVKDFPVFVAIDTSGNDLLRSVAAQAYERKEKLN